MTQNSFEPKPLDQQVIVITGASSGIGLATVTIAARQGARVVLSSRNEKELQQIVQSLRYDGGTAVAIPADVSKFEDMENLRDQSLKIFNRIDCWINNAGKSIYGYLMDVPLEEERLLFETNFWGVRNGCRAILPVMSTSGGVIINMGSEVSERAVPLQGLYSASKHAVKAYTDALRMEVEKLGLPIAVTLIRPAGVDTPFIDHARNYLRTGGPSLPPPVYHPDIVANAILDCAVKPRRDVYIGAPSRMFAIMDALMPAATDKMMLKKIFQQQSQGDALSHSREQESLDAIPMQEGRIRGSHEGYVASSSLYTSMSMHPWKAMALVGAISVLGAAILKK